MESESLKFNTFQLEELKEKYQDIKTEVDLLANNIKNKNWKKTVFSKLFAEIHDFTDNTELLFSQLSGFENFKGKFYEFSENLISKAQNLLKNNDQNIESLMTAKLTDLYKLQNSISLLTEQVYKEKMTVFKSHKKEIPNIGWNLGA